MFIELLRNIFFFALHVENSSVFPKPLSKKDEEECFLLMSQGDTKARNRLIEHNLRLVAHIVKKYSSVLNFRIKTESKGFVQKF